jgi:hypothetical protein
MSDERVIGKARRYGFLGPVASSFTLCWLASHRGRLRSLILGGRRLVVIVAWDSKGTERNPRRTDAEVEAIRLITYGPRN